MISIFVILLVLCLWGIRFSHFHEDYCDIVPTTAIKGIFAVVILASHLWGYIHLQPTFDNLLFCHILLGLGQSMVALYFFYSGYGICESLKCKEGYADRFFKNRFLKTLLHFDLAVLLFVIASFFLKIDFFSQKPYTLSNYLFCWIGWKSVGDSNWFMFVILALYLISFLAMKVRGGWMAAKILIPTVLLWVFLSFTHPEDKWWYDTLATFPLGMLYSQLKPGIDRYLRKPYIWWMTFFGLTAAYFLAHHFLGIDKWGLVNCLFCLIVVLSTMKVHFGNPVLRWLGLNAFAIYILQRLPMNILSGFGLNQKIAIFVPSAIIITFLLAEGFTRTTRLINRKLFYAK